MKDIIFIQGLAAKCRIGIFDWERKIRQKVLIDLEFPAAVRKAARHDRIGNAVDYKSIAKHTLAFVGKSHFYLIETLAERLAASLLARFPIRELKLCVSKPGAIRNSRNVGVQITRKRK